MSTGKTDAADRPMRRGDREIPDRGGVEEVLRNARTLLIRIDVTWMRGKGIWG